MDKKGRRSFVRIRGPGERRPEAPPPETAPPEQEPDAVEEAAGPGERTRIVIPRQERGGPERPEQDIELREVRYGQASRGPYLRVVPRQRRFTRVAPGHLEATRLGSTPADTFGRYLAGLRQVMIGSPFATSQAIHERLTKVKALAVLGSDPLSSSAYATEEALIILAMAGSGALVHVLPITLVIALLMALVVMSYRQTQKAYPTGGGAYIVAHENLGKMPGLVAGAALMVDYVLVVSVSVAAGVAAITSAVPELFDWRVALSVGVILFFTLGNMRGVRESGTLFAAPTYFFIVAMGAVVATGTIKVLMGDAPGSVLEAAPPQREVVATQALTFWLILRAFSSGGAALTGIEAMSNAVPNFKPPESDNARKTLTAMAVIAIYLFIGITFLTTRYGLVPSEEETIVSQLGRQVLGENALYFGYQAATALVLFFAANTGFNAFPLLSAILARDKYMPRQFSFRGDRLAYSHGIIVLAGLAAFLLVVFEADVTRLIPLYAVGVFVSFTLSQSGMVRHWLRLRGSGWRVSLLMNGSGAIATGIVAVIIGATKFTHGAWISILVMAVLVVGFEAVRRHYDWFEEQVHVEEDAPPPDIPTTVPAERSPTREHIVVPVDGINKVSLAAIAFVRELSGRATAVHVTDDREEAEDLRARWEKLIPDVPLLIIESPYRAFVAPMLAYVGSLQRADPGTKITVVLPAFVPRHWWERTLHNQDVQRLKPHLKKRPGVRVIDLPYRLEEE